MRRRYVIWLLSLVLLASATVWANGNLFENGFETNNYTGWTLTDASSLSSIISTSGLSMIGNFCWKIAGDGTHLAFAQSSSFATGSADYYARFYFRTSIINSGSFLQIGEMGTDSFVRLSNANPAVVQVSAISVIGSCAGITANTTYYIEVHEHIASSGGGWELRVNGASCGSDLTRNTSGNAPTTFTIGQPSGTPLPNTQTFDFDELGVGNVNWLGPFQVIGSAVGGPSTVAGPSFID
jgi:hypothetical protein